MRGLGLGWKTRGGGGMHTPNLDCTWTVPTSAPPPYTQCACKWIGVHGECALCTACICTWAGDHACALLACALLVCARGGWIILCLWRRDALLFFTACALAGPLVEFKHTRGNAVWVHVLPHWDLCVVSVRLGVTMGCVMVW